MTDSPRTIGLILAGGRSRRMQGQDKALLALRDESLLTRVIHRLRPQTDALALSSNTASTTFSGYGIPVFPDRLPGFLGPLAGIHAGLVQYPQDNLLSVAVDLPFLPPDLVLRLRAGMGEKSCAYVCIGEHHVLAILWRPEMAANVEEYLLSGGRRIKEYLAVHGQPVRFDQQQDRGLFFNINTPDDLASAEQELQLQVGVSKTMTDK